MLLACYCTGLDWTACCYSLLLTAWYYCLLLILLAATLAGSPSPTRATVRGKPLPPLSCLGFVAVVIFIFILVFVFVFVFAFVVVVIFVSVLVRITVCPACVRAVGSGGDGVLGEGFGLWEEGTAHRQGKRTIPSLQYLALPLCTVLAQESRKSKSPSPSAAWARCSRLAAGCLTLGALSSSDTACGQAGVLATAAAFTQRCLRAVDYVLELVPLVLCVY